VRWRSGVKSRSSDCSLSGTGSKSAVPDPAGSVCVGDWAAGPVESVRGSDGVAFGLSVTSSVYGSV
jgi:hypothetical protein